MRPFLLLAPLALFGCTDGTPTVEDTAVDWCTADSFTRWNVQRRGEGTPGVGNPSAYDGDGGSIWWQPETVPEGGADTGAGAFYRDGCPSTCVDFEDNTCPCGMVPTEQSELTFNQFSRAGTTTIPEFNSFDDTGARQTACVSTDGDGASWRFTIDDAPFGQLTIRSSTVGSFVAGEAGGHSIDLELFALDEPYSVVNDNWSYGQLDITSTGSTFEGTLNGGNGLGNGNTQEIVSISVVFSATEDD